MWRILVDMSTSKFRPVSLINVGGKVLEKTLIYRFMHHMHINNLLHHNQFGFTPKKCTTDAAITVKEFIEEGLRKGLITILFSLDVKRAFDAAWWSNIIMALKDFNCPRNLYNLTKSCFSHITAVMSIKHLSGTKSS
jgi:hypothetical protein